MQTITWLQSYRREIPGRELPWELLIRQVTSGDSQSGICQLLRDSMPSLFLLFPWALLIVSAEDKMQDQTAPWSEPAWLFFSDTYKKH